MSLMLTFPILSYHFWYKAVVYYTTYLFDCYHFVVGTSDTRNL